MFLGYIKNKISKFIRDILLITTGTLVVLKFSFNIMYPILTMIWNRKYSGSDSLRDEVNHAGCFGRSRQQPFLTYFSLTVHRKCPYNKRSD